MQAALRQVLHDSFGDYVYGLESLDCSSFPIVLNNAKLKNKAIQELIDESDAPFDFSDGVIGQIAINAGWTGNLQVTATNVALNFAFNPMKLMRPQQPLETLEEEEDGMEYEVRRRSASDVPSYGHQQMPWPAPFQPPPPPPRDKGLALAQVPAQVPPRYCSRHNVSERRVKSEPQERQCQNCRMVLQTSYAEFTFCPPCSEQQQRCLICGDSAGNVGTYVPASSINTGHSRPDMDQSFASAPPPPPPPPQAVQRMVSHGQVGMFSPALARREVLPRTSFGYADGQTQLLGQCGNAAVGLPLSNLPPQVLLTNQMPTSGRRIHVRRKTRTSAT